MYTLILRLLILLSGVLMAACQASAPPPPVQPVPVHVTGFPLGHPLNPSSVGAADVQAQ